jgi:hypothetical protein
MTVLVIEHNGFKAVAFYELFILIVLEFTALSLSAAGSEASGPQLLPVRALNEVFIGESLSSRYLGANDPERGIQ